MSDQAVVRQEVKDIRRNYTRNPNILFESYADLRPQEKWLYINLVYLCGSRGTRHLSLRYIHDRTGISLGALSGHKDPAKNDPGMIRRLHNAGLIHAEIKRRVRSNGKESDQPQYHITIVDIWQLNEAFFAAKRSESEHSLKEDESGVQNPNSSVQNPNTSEEECSESERERSENDTNIRLQSKTTNGDKITEQDITDPAIADTHFLSSLSTDELLEELRRRDALPKSIPQSNPKPAKPTRKRPPKEEQPKPDPTPMPASDMAWSAHKCMLLFDAWRGSRLIGRYKIKEAETCAKGLAEQYTEEQVRAVYKAMNESAYWQERGGADICNVSNNISKEIKKIKLASETAPETQQSDTQVYWNATGKKRCMDPDQWRWMSYEEAISFGYTPDQKLTEREIRDTETRRQMKREIETRKEQEKAHG